MDQSKSSNQISTKIRISSKALFPCIAYWDLLVMNTFQLDNVYIGTGAVSILGFWGFLKNSFILQRNTILPVILLIIPSIIGYIYYGTSNQAIFSLFITIGISFYVNYFITYKILQDIIYMISKVAALLSIILIIFYPILEEEGRLFLVDNEPSHIAIALIGPLFYFSYKRNYFYALPIIIAVLMTQSLSVFLVGFTFVFLFRNQLKNNFFKRNVKTIIILLMIFYLATVIPAVSWRLNSFSTLWLNFSFNNLNGTFFSFLSHAMTYLILILPNYTIGLGYFNYQEFLNQPEIQTYYSENPGFALRLTNEYGGHSILLRSVNELSLFAIALIYKLVQRLFALFKKEDFAVFAFLTVLILSRCLKLAGYFDFGFIFFVMAILIIPFNAVPKVGHY